MSTKITKTPSPTKLPLGSRTKAVKVADSCPPVPCTCIWSTLEDNSMELGEPAIMDTPNDRESNSPFTLAVTSDTPAEV